LRKFLLLALCFSSASFAGVSLTCSSTLGECSASVMVPASAVPYSYNFNLPKFNTDWGTLTGITLSTQATGTGEVSVANVLPSAQTFTNATSSAPLSISGPGGVHLNLTATASVAAGSIPAAQVIWGTPMGSSTPGYFPVPGFFLQNGLPLTGSNSITINSSNFGAYEGAGFSTATFTANAGRGIYQGTSVPGVFFGGDVDAGGEVTITYDLIPSDVYPAPEPGFGLLGGGLLGLTFLVRRVRARA